MKILSKIKGGFKNLLTKMVDYDSYIYLSTLFLVVGTLLWWNLEIKHSVEILNLQKEKSVILMTLEDSISLSKTKSDVLQVQSGIMLKQRNELIKAGQLIEMQHKVIKQFIQKLESLNLWPPKERRVDPNRII